jgi:RNA polymerase sigma-70 factor (ECF subfamily)
MVQAEAAGEIGDETGLDQILDRQFLTAALKQLSPAHRAVLVETVYRGRTTAAVARQLGIPDGTARSRLHYALHSLRQHLHGLDATAA